MKANAVNDVMQYVVKLQDRVEQLEVARAVAEAFKVPEAILLEQLKLQLPPQAPPRITSAGTLEIPRVLGVSVVTCFRLQGRSCYDVPPDLSSVSV